MCVYFRFSYRWLRGVVPMLRYSMAYHRYSQYSRSLLRALVAGQVYHWRDLLYVFRLRHRAYRAHRQYQRCLKQLHGSQGETDKS
jgi:hypothetical protein